MEDITGQQTTTVAVPHGSVPPAAVWLGYAGLLPQVVALVLVATGSQWSWVALAAGFGYAALIFSFLGGVWWGQGMSLPNAPRWIFAAAVLPSLIGLALFLPWTLGWPWPGPSLLWLGVFLIGSPLVDKAIGPAAPGWMRLRWHLSLGLGGLTIALGALALR